MFAPSGQSRRYVRRLLRLHMLLLSLIVLQVCVAGSEIYHSTRQHLIEQAQLRQDAIAQRTAADVEKFYREILDELARIARANPDDPGTSAASEGKMLGPGVPWRVSPLIWERLQTEISALFVCDAEAPAPSRTVSVINSVGEMPEIQQAIAANVLWVRSVRQPAISPLVPGRQRINLAAVPLGASSRWLLTAIVPASRIERFLQPAAGGDVPSLAVGDEGLAVIGENDPKLFGTDLIRSNDPGVRTAAEKFLTAHSESTTVAGGSSVSYDDGAGPRLIGFYPLNAGSSRWCLIARSSLVGGEMILNGLFRRAIFWAIFLVTSVTIVLISTTWQLIRGRYDTERARNQMMTQELTEARDIQLRWLPEASGPVPWLEVAAMNQPASEISGDFFDWFKLPDDRAVVTIGDVTGHGMSAAFLMATTQLLVRNTMLRVADPGKCLDDVNRQLCSQVFSGQFVTMIVMVIDPETLEVQIASAGHFPPLLIRGERVEDLDVKSDLMLGVKPDARFRTARLTIPKAAQIVLFTDGIVEARSPDGTPFGIEGLRQSVVSLPTASSLVARVVEDVHRFCGEKGIEDDVTLVAVRVKQEVAAASAAPAPRDTPVRLLN